MGRQHVWTTIYIYSNPEEILKKHAGKHLPQKKVITIYLCHLFGFAKTLFIIGSDQNHHGVAAKKSSSLETHGANGFVTLI